MKKIVSLAGYFIILTLFLNACRTEKTNTNNEKKDSLAVNSRDTLTKKVTPFYLDYNPTSTADNIIKHSYYTLSYSEKDEQAKWVSYKLTPSFLNKIKRTNNFREDPLVSGGSATLADYKASGYDRGHLAPAAAMSLNKTAMSESFFMSNMSPQKPRFNRGIWKILESQVRKWVLVNDSLFVVSGPILDHPLGTIGADSVTVPRAYYKTIVAFNNGTAKGIGFLLPNAASNKTIFSYVTSIDSIESVTGIDFYLNLNDSIETKIEASKKIVPWQ